MLRMGRGGTAADNSPCPAKTYEQLDLQALHRVWSRLVSKRTAVINKFAAFFWSAASQSDNDCASFARRCPTSWPSGTTFCHHTWCPSLLISAWF